jgi:aryl-alcohol dehydrogenase-like predicted oxidoreductase
MHTRKLGRHGPEVSEIGFGAWGIGGGWGPPDDEAALNALHRAVDIGVTFIDTAHMYGEGRSERLIGQVLRERAETIRVATKVPPLNRVWPARAGTDVDAAFPKGHIRAHTERSLTQLGLDVLDLQQAHVWNPDWLGQGDWQQEVTDLKAEGLIRAFGVSINDHQPGSAVELVRSGVVDTVQTIYNVFDQSPEDELFPACAENGVGVVVRAGLDEGGLTGTVRPGVEFEPEDWRNAYFRDGRPAQVQEHATRLVDDLGIDVAQLPETALRYVLSAPEVSSVVVGMRRPSTVDRNAGIGDGRGLPAEQVALLKKHRWERNFYM